MASQAVEKHVAGGDRGDCGGIEPEEHARVVRGPEIVPDLFDKAAVEE